MSPKNNPTQKPSDRTSIYVAVIGLFGTIILAIVSIVNTRTQVLLPVSLTETLAVTENQLPASTAYVCGDGEIPTISAPIPFRLSPNLIVIMIDETTSKETIDVVMSSLKQLLQAGDRVIIIIEGEQEYDKAILGDEKIQEVTPLGFAPSPVSPVIATTYIETPNGSAIQRLVATQTAEAAFVQATQTAVQFSCSMYQWSLSYQSDYSRWQEESKKVVSISMVKLEKQIQNYVATEPPSNGIFESLSLVSNISRIECFSNRFQNCVFVAITNMEDSRMQQPPSDMQMDYLRAFTIIGTISNCPLYNQACQNRVDYWRDYFAKNAEVASEFVNLDGLSNLLKEAIRH